MSLMGRFARLDSALQRGLDNGFAVVFGGRVVPAEIEEMLKQEIEDSIVGEAYGSEVPNVFVLGLSRKDVDTLLGEEPNLPEEMADRMSRFIRNSGWRPAGPLVVRVAEESGMRTGQLRVSSYSDPYPSVPSGFDSIDDMPQPDPVPSSEAAASGAEMETTRGDSMDQYWSDEESAAPRRRSTAPQETGSPTEFIATPMVEASRSARRTPTVSLLLQDGSSRTYRVREGSNIIGRSADADFRLPDTGVSRKHAEITWDGHDAILVDLHSTNGTTVNQTPIDNWLLADGDVITVGHSTIDVRIVWPQHP